MTVSKSTELLSKTVQSEAMTATEAAKAIEKTCLVLQHSKDQEWTNHRASVLSQAALLKINDPVVLMDDLVLLYIQDSASAIVGK